MGLTREQAQRAKDIRCEELFIPEWLDDQDATELKTIDGELAKLNGDDPKLRAELEEKRKAIRDKSTACIWMLTPLEMENLQQVTKKELGPNKAQNQRNFWAQLAIATVRDKDGIPTFTKDDHAWLSKFKSFRALNRIANAAMAMNGLNDKDQEEILKN